MEVNCTSAINTSSVFQSLTHLDIADQLLLDESQTGLEDLHSLSHLFVILITKKSIAESVKRLLSNVQLRVLGLRVMEPHKEVISWLNKYSMNDPRVVLLPKEWTCWAKLGQGSMLVWELVDEILQSPQPKEGTPKEANAMIGTTDDVTLNHVIDVDPLLWVM
ncbi:hypothetical protein DFJ58DRAFT_844417 [Suillus subalutaceus]|uniref:uncharacterized protein n=1 Tax=Suillus subalutaceus TaxID=48586 RepID=UPI001B87E489|nr:uncharacterized protein DFJ58DRAFT_847079 [Suillus subalutaceus]XP_041240268.1 uncharacterized protein DFJ58DRAFT_844417 [Suillus subalutaceus]KAG1836254.1 hypothetical protein DFJ58DRAFT_847079 [Suillus subalutaceus]KAG1843311.1 hypothetical protein DFJ58DRAFT_844417 [Suillus subalutaceus]